MNLQIMEFENAILNFCISSELPSEVKRLVLLEVLGKVEKQADKDINYEADLRKQQEEHKTIKLDENGEVVEEDEQGISEQDKLGELAE